MECTAENSSPNAVGSFVRVLRHLWDIAAAAYICPVLFLLGDDSSFNLNPLHKKMLLACTTAVEKAALKFHQNLSAAIFFWKEPLPGYLTQKLSL